MRGNGMKRELVMPDYKNCIANLPNSILKKFGVETVGDTLPLLDPYLEKDYKNIVVILLDGMGKCIIEKHLREKGAFRSHLAGIYKSVFLSTTTAATTSIMSGLQPCEHCWLGWDCYYPSIDKNVTIFLNVEQDTDKPAADYNVAFTVTPYENVVTKLNNAGKTAHLIAPFAPPHPKSFEAISEKIETLCKEPGQKYIYAYWNQPDGLLHRHGSKSFKVHRAIKDLERAVDKLSKTCEDTLIIVTADHGHIDNEYKVLQDYPQLMECLVRKPSLEPRVLNFFVKEGKEEFFVQEFNRLFGDKFLLMPMEEAIEKNLFGTKPHNKEFRGMLGNYLAIATDDLTIYFNEERWVSMHGSLTEEEMLIPLIVFDGK